MSMIRSVFTQLALGLFLGLSLAACGGEENGQPSQSPSSPETTGGSQGASIQKDQTESERLNTFFEKLFDRDLERSPMSQTYLGIKTDYGKWDDISDARQDEDIALVKADLEKMRRDFDMTALDEEARLSYRIFEYISERTLEGDRWRHHGYPINQMFGWQSRIPSFLINMHQVTSVADAEAYIERLQGVEALMGQVIDQLDRSADAGVIAPAFVFPLVIEDSRNVITGAPFDDGEDSPLFADIKGKIEGLEIDDKEKAELVQNARTALLESVKPAYQALVDRLQTLSKMADGNPGVWALPDGKAYYNYELGYYTTTGMTADEVHELGVQDVARIHDEMRTIMKEVGFDGTLADFFAFMREDQQFYYPNTDEGREEYLQQARDVVEAMKAKIDDFFAVKPKADMIVKRVEAFREKSAGKAFYQQPALDGSRPGIFYVNLYDMSQMPIYQLEALAYHEGTPGHHMQIAIKQELEGLPRFRKFAYFGAYTEGWGLYAEKLGKEMGFYEDPYSDFGRLAMELWRAARLVVDTGLHAKKWSREQAIAYLDENTPNPHDDNVRAIERYLVMPGQATSYKVGMIRILDLRAKAKSMLGQAFDIRGFHDVILKDAALPLSVLEEQVDRWVAATSGPSQ
jgi:uncharacterized protein (DUF885 family)